MSEVCEPCELQYGLRVPAVYFQQMDETPVCVWHRRKSWSSRPPFGSVVASARRAKGWSQGELGVRVERSESWVSQVERGARSVDRVSVQKRLSDVLGVNLVGF